MKSRDHQGNPATFSIKYVTCNRTQGTGGKLKELKRVTLPLKPRAIKGRKGNNIQSGRQMIYRNFYDPETQSFTKVYTRLILEFNGEMIID